MTTASTTTRNPRRRRTKQTTLAEFRELLSILYHGKLARYTTQRDHVSRSIVCSPFGGNYGEIAGWIIAVNGSPPKGLLIIQTPDTGGFANSRSVYVDGRTRRIHGEIQLRIIRRFCAEFMAGKKTAFEIAGETSGNG